MTVHPRPPAITAAIDRARRAAEQLVAGAVSPIEGARTIEAAFADCYDFYQKGDTLIDGMAVFAGRSDEWEEFFDQPLRREEIETQIVDEAKAYLILTPP
jgi:hypothetical protein